MLCERKGFLSQVRQELLKLSSMITRIVSVNRTRSPQEALNATGRKQYVNDSVVQSMPKGEGEETEVVFFKPDPSAYDRSGLISDDNLEKEFEKRGLKPVDPYSLAKVNEDDPSFADSHPNGTHWKDSDGCWCYTAFSRWNGSERRVSVNRHGNDWHDGWWFGGVRK